MTVNNGNYTVGWSGYGVLGFFYYDNVAYYIDAVSGSTPLQAWGVSASSYSPLSDNNGNAYYQGIPKILYNNF